MRALDGFAATSPVVRTEAPSTHSRLKGALRHRVEVTWSPSEETSDANAIHGGIASAALNQQAITAISAN
jgi:hypothetical protein